MHGSAPQPCSTNCAQTSAAPWLQTEPGWDHNPWEPPKHKAALQILEVLRAAGFRPTVYTDAALPDFARPSGNRVLLQLDLFDCYDVEWCRQRGLPVAGRWGGVWHALASDTERRGRCCGQLCMHLGPDPV